MSEARDSVDLTALPRFLEHLAASDPMASRFARRLLDDGDEVVQFWGPRQMDVWNLTIRRAGYLLAFGMERGVSDGVSLRPATTRDAWPRAITLRLAIFAWARAHAVPLTPDDPLHFHVDLLARGTAALDWLATGHEGDLVRIDAAYREGLDALGPLYRHGEMAAREAMAIRRMEDVATALTARR